jgi:hypothetical protein
MKTYLQYFTYSTIFAIIALITCYLIGGWKAVIIGATLGILEISLSFDNAVVNASVLTNMSAIWRKRFLFWGILIAVFGARLLIPIFIVAITAAMNPIAVFHAAFFDTATYAHLIENIHIYVSGFGSAFLGMVFLKFFFDENKSHHWIPWIEKYMQKLGVIESIQALVMLLITVLFAGILSGTAQSEYLMSSIWGIILYLVIDGISYLIKPKEIEVTELSPNVIVPSTNTGNDLAKTAGTAGIVAFMYLEVLDTSFSLDGVIGAFAVTQDIVLILLGLAIGAFFVRSFTIFIVDKKVLNQLRYLEHGAFWSIGILAAAMLLKTVMHISEFYIVGATLLVLAISVMHSRFEAKKAFPTPSK